MEKKDIIGRCFKHRLWNEDWAYNCVIDISGDFAEVLTVREYHTYNGKMRYSVEMESGLEARLLTGKRHSTEISKLDFDNKWQEANLRLEQAYINRQRKIFA